MIDLIDRARRLPVHHPLRTMLLLDIESLRIASEWTQRQADVPAASYAVLGLAENHLRSRLIRCEERIGEHIRVPA